MVRSLWIAAVCLCAAGMQYSAALAPLLKAHLLGDKFHQLLRHTPQTMKTCSKGPNLGRALEIRRASPCFDSQPN